MKVRTGELHSYPEGEAQVDQFEVSPVPYVDYAAQALREAQDAYFAAYPSERKNARELLWNIGKRAGL